MSFYFFLILAITDNLRACWVFFTFKYIYNFLRLLHGTCNRIQGPPNMEFGSGCCIKGRMPNRGGPLSGMPYGLLPTARGSVFCPVFGLPFLPDLLLPQQVVVALLSLGPLRRFHAVARCGGGGRGFADCDAPPGLPLMETVSTCHLFRLSTMGRWP